jgi:NAD+ diphosphatase
MPSTMYYSGLRLDRAAAAREDPDWVASQAWPFPAGLMVGFTAEALASTIRADQREVLEARWFTAPELRARIADPSLGGPYRVDSIGKILIEDWLATQA